METWNWNKTAEEIFAGKKVLFVKHAQLIVRWVESRREEQEVADAKVFPIHSLCGVVDGEAVCSNSSSQSIMPTSERLVVNIEKTWFNYFRERETQRFHEAFQSRCGYEVNKTNWSLLDAYQMLRWSFLVNSRLIKLQTQIGFMKFCSLFKIFNLSN